MEASTSPCRSENHPTPRRIGFPGPDSTSETVAHCAGSKERGQDALEARAACCFPVEASVSRVAVEAHVPDELQSYQRTLGTRSLTTDKASALGSSAPTPTCRPRHDTRDLHLGAELEDRAALGDHGRAARRADVLLDPLGGAPGGLVRASLVLTDRHGHAAVPAAAKGPPRRRASAFRAERAHAEVAPASARKSERVRHTGYVRELASRTTRHLDASTIQRNRQSGRRAQPRTPSTAQRRPVAVSEAGGIGNRSTRMGSRPCGSASARPAGIARRSAGCMTRSRC